MTTALNVFAQKKIVGNPDYPVRDNAAIDINQVAASRPPVPFGYKPATTVGLTVGYYGGEMWVDGVLTNIADGTLALTASTTNYVEATRAGAISKNTAGFTAGQTPLFEITTDGGSITAINDRRIGNAPLSGMLSLSVAGGAGDTALTAAQARNNILVFTGALTGARGIFVPAVVGFYAIYNNTSGAYILTVKTAAGTGIVVAQGTRALLYCDGTNVVAADAPGLNVQRFNASGTWTCPAGVTKAFISGVGGGGGGGGGSNGGGSGGGGGGGAKAVRQTVTVVPTTEYTVTIGGGGAGGGINADGSAGATSSFGALVSLAGGGAGATSANGSHAGHAGEGNQSGQPGSISTVSPGGLGGGIGGGQGGGSGGAGGAADANTGGGGGGGNSTGAGSTGGAGGSGSFLVEW